tara:strand:+ start:3212 stop:3634 length:423 start_codon:yes stop_codon:yes gene_type:complete
MFKFLQKKEKVNQKDNLTLSLACLLIHVARIDQNYSTKEREIIKQTLLNLGADEGEIDIIIKEAESVEKDSNEILTFTKEAKNLKEENKLLLIESLWSIIYSDENADMYETNLMRRLSGLLYLDKKIVGDIKEKIKIKKL